MAADLLPGSPRPRESLSSLILSERHAPGTGSNRPQAPLPVPVKELTELGLVLTHTR
jgi:hypothetical protein